MVCSRKLEAMAILSFLSSSKWVLVGLAFGGLVAYHAYATKQSYEHGYAVALAKAQEETRNAINELDGTADDARVRFNLCTPAVGVWSYTDNRCAKK